MPLFPSPVVDGAWLAEHLGEPGLVVLDASWYLPVSGRNARAEYQAAHLPGALYFDLDAASATDTPLPHMLPSEDDFAALSGGLGIGPDSRVVVYDGSGANLSAARVWWMYRVFGHRAVSILDGGLPRWRAEERPLTTAESHPNPVSFTAHLDPSRVRNRADVEQALARGTAQLVDMRSAGRFGGTDPEPRAGLPSGHMPGARNLPYASLVSADGTVLPLPLLRQRLREAGVDPDQPVIGTCGSGVSACTLLLALDLLGVEGASLYDGSWTEWASSGGDVVKGR